MKKFFIVFGLVAIGYGGYQKFHAPSSKDGGGQAAVSPGDPQILQTSNPAYYGTMEPGGPVLRMKPETLAKLQALAPSKVVMFATAWCPYCAKARALFQAQGVRFIELDLERDGTAEAFQRDVMGLSGFPTIIIGNRVTQGYDEGQILASLKEI